MAAPLLDWLQRNRYEVPAEVGVIGSDDDPLYSLASIGLTTVCLPVEEIGAACAEILEYICRQVGFSSPGRFAAAFRARHGVCPRQFQLSALH